MSAPALTFLRKSLWTTLGFIGTYALRFLLNILLTRLLAPDMMGVLVIVYAVRLGMELLTDIGIEQNIIHHPDGISSHFRNVAWTLQVARGAFLSLIFAVCVPIIADFYHIERGLLYVMAISPLLGGLHSTAIFVLVRQLDVSRRNLFELGSEVLAFGVTITLTWLTRSVWAPVCGAVLAVIIRSALSYLLPDARQRFVFDWPTYRRIFTFGRWIALTSLLIYATGNLDRLFFGRFVPLQLVGVYGIARTMAEIPTVFARRLSYQILFPAMARWQEGGVHDQLLTMRRLLVLAAAAGLALAATGADWIIGLLYDPRYVRAGWILAILLPASLISILANLNEGLLLAEGRAASSTLASLGKLAAVLVGLPLAFKAWGFAFSVLALVPAELVYYLCITFGIRIMRRDVLQQDLMAIGMALGFLLLFELLRAWAGFSSPFAGIAGGSV